MLDGDVTVYLIPQKLIIHAAVVSLCLRVDRSLKQDVWAVGGWDKSRMHAVTFSGFIEATVYKTLHNRDTQIGLNNLPAETVSGIQNTIWKVTRGRCKIKKIMWASWIHKTLKIIQKSLKNKTQEHILQNRKSIRKARCKESVEHFYTQTHIRAPSANKTSSFTSSCPAGQFDPIQSWGLKPGRCKVCTWQGLYRLWQN